LGLTLAAQSAIDGIWAVMQRTSLSMRCLLLHSLDANDRKYDD